MKAISLGILVALAALVLSAGAVLATEPTMGCWQPSVGRQATKALNLLEIRGYGNFQNFHAQGSDFKATAAQKYRTLTLLVDPGAGTVRAEN